MSKRFSSVSSDLFAWNHIVYYRYTKERVDSTFFNTPRALSNLGLWATRLYPRSDMLSLSVLTIQPKSTLFMKNLKLCELWTVSVCFHSWCKDCFFLGISFWIFLTDAGGCTGQVEAAGNRLLLPVWKWISQFNQVHILIFRLLSQTNLFKGITDINQVLCPFIKCWSLSKFLFSHGYTVLLSMEMQLWIYYS